MFRPVSEGTLSALTGDGSVAQRTVGLASGRWRSGSCRRSRPSPPPASFAVAVDEVPSKDRQDADDAGVDAVEPELFEDGAEAVVEVVVRLDCGLSGGVAARPSILMRDPR
jgi:hypothetical protein